MKSINEILEGIKANTPDTSATTKKLYELSQRSIKLRDKLKAMPQSPTASEPDSDFIRKRDEQLEKLKQMIDNG